MVMITNYWILDGIVVLMITCVVAAYLFMTRKFNYWKERGVFEIKPLPFLGNFGKCVFLSQTPGFLFRDLYNRTKGHSYIGLYIFDKPALLIRDPKIIKHMLIKDFNYFCNRSCMCDLSDRLGRSTLFLMKNPTWRPVRNHLTPIFTSNKLKKMYNLSMECVINLDKYLDSLTLNGNIKMIDAKDLFANLITDMIGTTAFGLNIDSTNNPECEFREKGRTVFNVNFVRGLQLFIGFYYPELSSLARVTAFGNDCTVFLRKVFWDTINHRIKSGENRGDLIDTLIEFKKNYGKLNLEDFQFDGDDLVAQAAIFLIAGFETTSTTITFTLYELALHREIQEKVRKEIFDALHKTGGKFTYDMVLSLSYLDMVIFETMRMLPVLPIIDREAIQHYKVPNSNLVIEKGTPIFLSLLGLHYDPEYFPNPNKFDPERFNEENKNNIPSCVYMPFGEGPRKCIGLRLGLLQAKLAIIKILCRYEVTPCEKTLIPMVLDPRCPLSTPMGGKLYLNIQKLNLLVTS